MIIKLSERYRYNKEKKDLKTCFIGFSDVEYFEIDLLKEVLELENNQQFMKIWKEEGSKEYCKYKYCLSLHNIPSVEPHGMYRINDYENSSWTDERSIYPHKMIFIRTDNGCLLLDKRRWDIEILNNDNILIEKLS